MARKTPLDKLASAITDILDEYAGDVTRNVGEIADRMAAKGVQALRQKSKQTFPNGSGDYAKGWKVEKNGKKHRLLNKPSIIYNELAGLPHLLEHGHVIRNGTGRVYGEVRGREHIAPVEEELVGTFEREVMSKL